MSFLGDLLNVKCLDWFNNESRDFDKRSIGICRNKK